MFVTSELDLDLKFALVVITLAQRYVSTKLEVAYIGCNPHRRTS